MQKFHLVMKRDLALGKYFPAVVDDQTAPRYKIYTELFKRPQCYFLLSSFLPSFAPSLFLSFFLFLFGLMKHIARELEIYILNGYHIIRSVLTMGQILLGIYIR